MAYSEEQISALRRRVSEKLSKKRFSHTLGVERAAAFLAKKILPEKESEIRAAALLHDITKELEEKEQIDIIRSLNNEVSESDMLCPSVYHSLTAPFVIKSDFAEFADEDVLNAVYNHTVGAPDMSLFDEIIFISDYVEEGRTYPACVEIRERLITGITERRALSERISLLHDATIDSLNNTIVSIVKRGGFLHEKTVMTRNAFLGRRPVPLK